MAVYIAYPGTAQVVALPNLNNAVVNLNSKSDTDFSDFLNVYLFFGFLAFSARYSLSLKCRFALSRP
jgi:hypothetical protein